MGLRGGRRERAGGGRVGRVRESIVMGCWVVGGGGLSRDSSRHVLAMTPGLRWVSITEFDFPHLLIQDR